MGVSPTNKIIGDYFTLQRGNTYKSALLGQAGPVLLGLATIQRNGGFRSDSLKTYGGKSPENLLLYPGDIYVSLKDVTQSADLLGAVARVPKECKVGRLTQDTIKLIPKTPNLPINYLYWLLRTPQYRAYCRAHATGTTNLGLSREDFLNFPAPFPKKEQQNAANLLDILENRIELNRRINQTLEAIARALFKSWFVDFDPVRAKAEGRDTGLPKHIADLFPHGFEDSELGDIPRGWTASKWGNILKLEYGKSLKGYHNLNEIIPVYGTNGKIGTTTEHLCNHQGVIIGRKGAYRGVHFCSEPFFVIDTAFYVEPTTEVEMRWVYYELLRLDINSMDSGSAIPSTSREELYNLQVLKPTYDVQNQFVRILSPLWDRQIANDRESRTLSAIRDALLPKLISGELRVPDAERIVGRFI